MSTAVHRLGKGELKYLNTFICNRVHSDMTVKKFFFFAFGGRESFSEEINSRLLLL